MCDASRSSVAHAAYLHHGSAARMPGTLDDVALDLLQQLEAQSNELLPQAGPPVVKASWAGV